jgi:hypothetical protein
VLFSRTNAGVHAKRWSYHYEGRHWRHWYTLGADIGHLRRLLTHDDYTPTDGDIDQRRRIVANALTAQFRALENTPSRRGRPKRDIDIRWRPA